MLKFHAAYEAARKYHRGHQEPTTYRCQLLRDYPSAADGGATHFQWVDTTDGCIVEEHPLYEQDAAAYVPPDLRGG